MSKQAKAIGWLALATAVATASVWSNNLQITNTKVVLPEGSDGTALIQFDISWENSWRADSVAGAGDAYFHDAAWVFFKVRNIELGVWQHVVLHGSGTNPPLFETGSGTPVEFVVPADRMGAIMRRSAPGTGTLAATNLMVRWNLADSDVLPRDSVDAMTFAVEMVYVAEGPFWAGDGAVGFTKTLINTPVANVAGGFPTGQTAPVSTWPNGYNAFYCMKYQITEGQWVDFFNLLTDAQKTKRDITGNVAVYGGKNSDNVVNRNTLAWTTGDATTAAPDRACNFLTYGDGAAFAAWAGLRPMTELEYEKACRGPLDPVPGEFAWGTTEIFSGVIGLSGVEDGTEWVTSDVSMGAARWGQTGGLTGPLRAGIFATNGASRAAAGASYWGIMELSGNLYERVINLSQATGRSFTGRHGDGTLTAAGEADVADLEWPSATVSPWGHGYRGGDGYGSAASRDTLRVSDRSHIAINLAQRLMYTCFRAARTAP